LSQRRLRLFLETGRAEVMLKVKEVHPDTGISEEWDAGVVSDGTLRVLGHRVTVLRRGNDYGRPLPADLEDLRADRGSSTIDHVAR
jgi:hypothetical protein